MASQHPFVITYYCRSEVWVQKGSTRCSVQSLTKPKSREENYHIPFLRFWGWVTNKHMLAHFSEPHRAEVSISLLAVSVEPPQHLKVFCIAWHTVPSLFKPAAILFFSHFESLWLLWPMSLSLVGDSYLLLWYMWFDWIYLSIPEKSTHFNVYNLNYSFKVPITV